MHNTIIKLNQKIELFSQIYSPSPRFGFPIHLGNRPDFTTMMLPSEPLESTLEDRIDALKFVCAISMSKRHMQMCQSLSQAYGVDL